MRLNTKPRPLRSADLSRVQAVFTDVDGTLTSGDKLESRTLRAMERLRQRGLRLVLVSGRPAGWGECWVRTLPVDGVIVENGGLSFVRDARGRVHKRYAQPRRTRSSNRVRLLREVRNVLRSFPGAQLSSDSAHTEVDIAIDHNEQAKLGTAAVREIEAWLTRRGLAYARSSVHLNCWIGSFDKLSMVRRFLQAEWNNRLRAVDPRFVYVGDSLNDAPMFGAFSLGVGVANVRDVMEEIEHPPAYITLAREGRGFEELAAAILRQQS